MVTEKHKAPILHWGWPMAVYGLGFTIISTQADPIKKVYPKSLYNIRILMDKVYFIICICICIYIYMNIHTLYIYICKIYIYI